MAVRQIFWLLITIIRIPAIDSRLRWELQLITACLMLTCRMVSKRHLNRQSQPKTCKTDSPCTIIRENSKHSGHSAIPEVAMCHLLIHLAQEVVPVINGRELFRM